MRDGDHPPIPSVPAAKQNALDATERMTSESRPDYGVEQQSNILSGSGHENWDSWTFLDMRDKIRNKLKPEVVRNMALGWENLGKSWSDAMRKFKTDVADVTKEHWQGEAAVAANGAVTGIVGDFPEDISQFCGKIASRARIVADNFQVVIDNFPETPDSSWDFSHKGDDAEFNKQSVGELTNLYNYTYVADGDKDWKFANYAGENDTDSNFDNFRRILDQSFVAATQAKRLMSENYSGPIQDAMRNLPVTPEAATYSPGPAPGEDPNKTQTPGSTSGGGKGGGGGTPSTTPDMTKELKNLEKKVNTPNTEDKNKNKNTSGQDTLQQVASTATQALSSLGSQLGQAAQQAQQAIQQVAQQGQAKTALNKNLKHVNGIGGALASPISRPTGAGAGGGAKSAGAGGKGSGGGAGPVERLGERTVKAGAPSKTTQAERPTAGLSQTNQGAGGTGAGGGAPAGGSRGAGGDKVHKVLKALRTRVNGEAVVGVGDSGKIGPIVAEEAGASGESADGSRT